MKLAAALRMLSDVSMQGARAIEEAARREQRACHQASELDRRLAAALAILRVAFSDLSMGKPPDPVAAEIASFLAAQEELNRGR